MHISKKLLASRANHTPTYSFEFFPPKTAQGVQNLYDRMDRMHGFGPTFIDVTWGAGGRFSQLTCEIVRVAQTTYGLETCMHLTCTDMERSKIDEALKTSAAEATKAAAVAAKATQEAGGVSKRSQKKAAKAEAAAKKK